MPEFLAPGVYVEEISSQMHPIEGVSTSIAGFIGVVTAATTLSGIISFAEYERAAVPSAGANLSLAVRGFFENGGKLCYVAGIAATDPLQTGLDALADVKLSIVCCPEENRFANAAAIMAAHCEQRKDRICILQSPQPALPDSTHDVPVHSSFAAYYYPWITVAGLGGAAAITVPPGGHIAGVYARMDTEKGVHVAPASVPLNGVSALSQQISEAQNNLLAARGINTLRNFPGKGILVWGAHTTSADSDYKYVSIRRVMIFLEQSITQGLQWAVFEPNGPPLWATLRTAVESFLFTLWKTGALMGEKLDQACFVRCDATTMTQNDIDAGRLILLVGVAPVRPAEFILLRITCQTRSIVSP
jgi:phage tail sheath protein FI